MGLQTDHRAFLTIDDLRKDRDRRAAKSDWRDASTIARQILEHPGVEPVDYRIASTLAMRDGDVVEALRMAEAAAAAEPQNAEFALHAGCLFNQTGQHAEAISYLIRAARTDPTLAEIYQQLAHASQALGDLESALRLALQAHRLDECNIQRTMVAAHLLSRLGRWDEAASLTLRGLAKSEQAAFAYRSLAAYREQLQDFTGALEAIDTAISIEPNVAEYHAYRAFMLIELSRVEEADAALTRTAQLEPDNFHGRRHAISLLVQKGELQQALRYGGLLLSARPDHPEYVSCMKYLLEAKETSAASFGYNEIAELKRSGPPRRFHAPPAFKAVLLRQARIVIAIALRDIRSRHGESRISIFWMLMEPFIHIGVLAIVFQFTMQGSPPLGTSFFLFYFTGVMPYLLLSHLFARLGSAIRGDRHLMGIPFIAPLEILLAKTTVEVFSTLLIFVTFIALFFLFGVDASPVDLLSIIYAFSVTIGIGFGLGCIAAALTEFGPAVEAMTAVILRLVYFTSGIFYLPSKLPSIARDILVWNPFLHVIDSMRVGFFKAHNPFWIDQRYPVLFAIFVVVAGLSSVTLLRRRMRTL